MMFSLLQKKYILFVGGNANGTNNKKCTKQFKGKTPGKLLNQKPVLSHKASDLKKKNSNWVNKICLPTPPRWVTLLFRKYEIHKGRHLYRTNMKAG